MPNLCQENSDDDSELSRTNVSETLRLRLGKRKGIDYDDEIAKSRLLREEQMKKDENGIRQSELHNARAKLVATIDDDDDDWLNDE